MVQERPRDLQAWFRRQYESFGPHFRIESGNPEYGFCGGTTAAFISELNGKSQFVGFTEDGKYHMLVDENITIAGDLNNDNAGPSVNIIGKGGDVTITAMRDGSVRIYGKTVQIDADSDINIKSCGNMNLKANSIFFDTNVINTNALKTDTFYLRNITFGQKSFSGLPINVDNIAAISGNGLSTLSDKLKESNVAGKLESMSGNLTEQLGGVTEQLSSIDTSAIQGQLGNVGKSLGQMNIPGLGGLG
tara:strand:+ start:8762 stop:9502 length:741 start_codon:yes stop_codon:yes gene_type:complete